MEKGTQGGSNALDELNYVEDWKIFKTMSHHILNSLYIYTSWGQNVSINCVSVPIRYRGGFDVIPGDEIKTQTQSYAMQPCKLDFGEPGIRGWAGTAAGEGEDETEKKKE